MIKLNVAERIALINVLPPTGSAATLRIIRELQGELSFTENELKHFSIKNSTLPDGRMNISWSPELTDETKDVKIGDAAKGIIVDALNRLNATGALHITMLPLYEKFVEDKE